MEASRKLRGEPPHKKSRYGDSQIISILKQAEAGAAVPDLCREHVPGKRRRHGGCESVLQLTLPAYDAGRLDAD